MTEELLPPAPCLNCGVEVSGHYCSNCGQERTTPIVPASHLLRDVVDEFFLIDAKLFRTLKPLITRPGFLTNEYIAGRRARYLSPFRLYFVISALYFLAFSFAHYDVAVMHALAFGLEQAHHAHVTNAERTVPMPAMERAGSGHAIPPHENLQHPHSASLQSVIAEGYTPVLHRAAYHLTSLGYGVTIWRSGARRTGSSRIRA